MNPITQPLIMYVCSACKSGWRSLDDAERCCKCEGCGGIARKHSTTCEECSRINYQRRSAEILERRLATAITINQAATMETGDDEPLTWWRYEDRMEYALMDLLEQICSDGWDPEIKGPPDDFGLPDLVEFVVGQRLRFDVQEALYELYQDYDDGPPDFDSEAVKFAQEAVDLAADTANYWGEGESYWVDIREVHEVVLREWLADGAEVAE